MRSSESPSGGWKWKFDRQNSWNKQLMRFYCRAKEMKVEKAAGAHQKYHKYHIYGMHLSAFFRELYTIHFRDLWRNRTAWMSPTRAKNILSICVRNAKFWATTAAVCNNTPRNSRWFHCDAFMTVNPPSSPLWLNSLLQWRQPQSLHRLWEY